MPDPYHITTFKYYKEFAGPALYPLSLIIMVQSLGLGRRLGRHRDGSVSATRIGLGRYAKNAT